MRIDALRRRVSVAGIGSPRAAGAVVAGEKFHVEDSRIGPGELLLGGSAGERIDGGIDLGDGILAAVHGFGLEELGIDGIVVLGEEVGAIVPGDSAAGEIGGGILDLAPGDGADRSPVGVGAGDIQRGDGVGGAELIGPGVDLVEVRKERGIGTKEELPLSDWWPDRWRRD